MGPPTGGKHNTRKSTQLQLNNQTSAGRSSQELRSPAPTRTGSPIIPGGAPGPSNTQRSSQEDTDTEEIQVIIKTVPFQVDADLRIEVPQKLLNFVKDECSSIGDWKGRSRVFSMYLFMITRHVPADFVPKIYGHIITRSICSDVGENAKAKDYFDRQIGQNQAYVKAMVVKYAKKWYQSDAAVWWVGLKLSMEKGDNFAEFGDKFPYPTTIRDLLVWKGRAGMEFTSHHVTDFWKRLIMYFDCEIDRDGSMGWLKNDINNFWFTNMRNVALNYLLTFIQAQGPIPNYEDVTSIKLGMRMENFAIPNNTTWPQVSGRVRAEGFERLVGNSRKYPMISKTITILNDIHHYTEDAIAGVQRIDDEEDGNTGSIIDSKDPSDVTAYAEEDSIENDLHEDCWYEETRDIVDITRGLEKSDPGFHERVTSEERTAHLIKPHEAAVQRLQAGNVLPEYTALVLPIPASVPTSKVSEGMMKAASRWATGDIEVKMAIMEAHTDQFAAAMEQSMWDMYRRKQQVYERWQVVKQKKARINQLLQLTLDINNAIMRDEEFIKQEEDEIQSSRKRHRITESLQFEMPSILRRKKGLEPMQYTFNSKALLYPVSEIQDPDDNGHFGEPGFTRDIGVPKKPRKAKEQDEHLYDTEALAAPKRAPLLPTKPFSSPQTPRRPAEPRNQHIQPAQMISPTSVTTPLIQQIHPAKNDLFAHPQPQQQQPTPSNTPGSKAPESHGNPHPSAYPSVNYGQPPYFPGPYGYPPQFPQSFVPPGFGGFGYGGFGYGDSSTYSGINDPRTGFFNHQVFGQQAVHPQNTHAHDNTKHLQPHYPTRSTNTYAQSPKPNGTAHRQNNQGHINQIRQHQVPSEQQLTVDLDDVSRRPTPVHESQFGGQRERQTVSGNGPDMIDVTSGPCDNRETSIDSTSSLTGVKSISKPPGMTFAPRPSQPTSLTSHKVLISDNGSPIKSTSTSRDAADDDDSEMKEAPVEYESQETENNILGLPMSPSSHRGGNMNSLDVFRDEEQGGFPATPTFFSKTKGFMGKSLVQPSTPATG